MTKKAHELEFISKIKRDGTGVILDFNKTFLKDEYFKLTSLSLTEKTFIASRFNSYVVKLKEI
jgi:hypothetical protein